VIAKSIVGLVSVAVVVAMLGRAAGAEPRPEVIDFTRDESSQLGEEYTAPPPDVKRPSLLDDKYRGVPGAPSGDAIEDPLAAPADPPRVRPVWLGVRIGGGMFDDAGGSARAGVALGAAARYRLGGAAFAAIRADWSQRGGERMAAGDAAPPIDVLGLGAGVGATVARSRATGLALALIGQLRGELRLADAPVRRAGLGVAIGAELALAATPFTLGARYEQGVTVLADGARDHAMLVEVGVDLR